jgi:glutamine amidotransferase PdxT
VKKEAEVKEEMLAPEEDERPCWVKELTITATACHPHDTEDEPGLHMMQARLLKEPQPMDEISALVWSAEESGVLMNLTNDDDGAPQVKKEVKDEV